MDKYYYTDTIYQHDSNIFYEKQNIIKKVKTYNWHKILNEYGWEKLNLKWIKKLNYFLVKVPKNSLFGVLDCGGDKTATAGTFTIQFPNFTDTLAILRIA